MIDAWLAYEAVEPEAFEEGGQKSDGGGQRSETGGRMITAAEAARRLRRPG